MLRSGQELLEVASLQIPMKMFLSMIEVFVDQVFVFWVIDEGQAVNVKVPSAVLRYRCISALWQAMLTLDCACNCDCARIA